MKLIRLLLIPLLLTSWTRLAAQVVPTGPRTLSQNVQIDRVDSETRLQLERAEMLLAEGQLQDTLDVFYQLIQERGAKLVGPPHKETDYARYQPLRLNLQSRLLQTPEILGQYRDQINDEAKRLFEDDDPLHRTDNLRRIVDRYFLSMVADQALLELGDIAMERGQIDRARYQWERIHSALRYEGQPIWFHLRELKDDASWEKLARSITSQKEDTSTFQQFVYPDSEIPIADVRARLVLASIVAEQRTRATAELRLFGMLHPDASGTLGGKRSKYVEALTGLLEGSEKWSRNNSGVGQWLTFAGNPTRNPRAAEISDVTKVVWRTRWERPLLRAETTVVAENEAGIPKARVAERQFTNLAIHPIVNEDLVFWSEGDRIRAVKLSDGAALSESAEVYPGSVVVEKKKPQMSVPIGTPRYTLTSNRRYVVARLGTSMPQPGAVFQPIDNPQGSLVVLDRRSLRSLLNMHPKEEGWSYEGTPVVDRQGRMFVAMRHRGVSAEISVSCIQVSSQRELWRMPVSSADTIGAGRVDEISSTLLTLGDGMVFVNTNLGSVAALDQSNGAVQWLVRYPRQGADKSTATQPAEHVFRDLTPCLLHEGILYVAPADHEQILAIDAMAGSLLWHTNVPRGMMDAVHLLGVSENHLIASGRRLWWIDRITGKLSQRIQENPFPAAKAAQPFGLGRGVLAGEVILWPARGDADAIYIVEESTGHQRRQPISLPDFQASAGNLVLAGNRLLVSTAEELIAFGTELAETP